jgi:6-pyruvoyltetrahydropterin/6-carboxytetrahydropterin synthase
MFEVTVGARFVATHQLRALNGVAEKRHAHTWRVKVTVAGPRLDKLGMLADFGLIRGHLAAVLGPLERRHLNRLAPFRERNPSAENVAVYVAERLAEALPDGVRVGCVEVEEEPGCVARYVPPRRRRHGRASR